MNLITAIKKELKRSATSTADAIFLKMLAQDLRDKNFKTDRVQKVREKYDI